MEEGKAVFWPKSNLLGKMSEIATIQILNKPIGFGDKLVLLNVSINTQE